MLRPRDVCLAREGVTALDRPLAYLRSVFDEHRQPSTSPALPEDLVALTSTGQLLVISPHLDDAFFSCSGVIKGVHDPIVHTVFAGDAPADQSLAQWDRDCGFSDGDNVMDHRRKEECSAASRLQATATWDQLLQEGYRPGEVDPVAVARNLSKTIEDVNPESVLFPLGLKHTDHLAVASAMWTIISSQEFPSVTWFMYAEKPYADRRPTSVRQRLIDIRSQALDVREITLPWRLKRGDYGAIRCYPSQLKGLRMSALRIGLLHQRIWRVVPRQG
jgi:LmbE family N-acetylglucosaminyl deacetylase